MRAVAPAARKLRLPKIRRVAVTDRWIVVSSLGQMAWRRNEGDDLGAGWSWKKERGFFHDFDIQGDQILMLGFPDIDAFDRSSRGGVVWRANLPDGLDRWEVVYESKEAYADLDVIRSEAALGSLRFLPRGGFLVVPSFVPGVLEFSAGGRLKSRWSNEELWAGEHWGAERVWTGGEVTPESFLSFLQARRTIDSIVALSEGPAILVREPDKGGARYRLGVLGSEVQWYDVPALDISPVAQLRGFVDGRGHIVISGIRRNALAAASIPQNEIVLLRMPE